MNNEKVLPNRCHEPFLSQKNRLTMRFFQGLKSFPLAELNPFLNFFV